jgi:hypothetical protein
MLINSLSVLFSFNEWEGITQGFAVVTAGIFLCGFYFAVSGLLKWKRILDQRDFNHPKLMSSMVLYRRSFMPGSEEKTSHHAEDFFNLKRLQSSSAVLDSLPNMLVGIGILGTFVGLSIGVLGLKDQSSADAIKSGIQDLLGSMSTAFVTSVLGMFSSLALTVVLRICHAVLTKSHKRFCERLDEKHFISNEQYGELEQARLRNMLLELFGHRMNDNIQSPGELFLQNLQANQSTSSKLENFGAELADGLTIAASTISAIEEQLGNRFGMLFQTHLGHHLKSMDDSLGRIRDKENDQAQGFSETLESTLNNLLEQFKQGLSEGASQEMEALRSNMSATSEALERLPAILTETQSGFSEMTNRFRDLGTELANQLADQMREVNRELAEQQSKSRKEAEEHTLLVASSTTKVTEEMANHLTRFMTAHTTSNEGLSDLIDQIHEVLAANRDVNGVIGSAITGLISASTSLGANTKEMSQSMNSMQTLNDKMLKLSDSLSGITQGLDAAIARQHEAVEDVFSQARGALVDQLDAYGKINSELGNIKDSYIQSLKVYQDSVNQAVNSNLEVFATKLASVAEGLTAAYTALQETVVEMEGLFAKNSKT